MISFKELVNYESLKKIAENNYAISGIPLGIISLDGTVKLAVGWQDICTKYHRVNPTTCKNCSISDQYIIEHIKTYKNEECDYIAYKCRNNMWDVAIPIIISDIHIATLFFGQFFYEDEVIDIEYFRAQALEFGFDEKEYLEALSRVPIFTREKVKHIIEYYKGLIMTLAESGLRQMECKNSQKELEKSQKYLNTIFNSVNDAILVHDFYGNILDVNQTAVAMFGYKRSDFIRMNIADVAPKAFSNSNYNIEEVLRNMVNKTSPLVIELICRKNNNDELWVEVNDRVTNIDGNERLIAVIRDITERKQAELASHNEALELEKLRTEFFANISHELRTPLNIILGTNKIISMNLRKEKIDIEKIDNNINIEKQNCLRLLRLINNLIDSTKLDAGYFELHMINCNIVNIVEEITLSVAEYIDSNNLTLIFDTEIEEKIVACDLDKIERIMLNILSNAVKFTRPGGNIFVNISDGEEFITITIEDTGEGIPEDKLNIIFDRFRQVDKSFTRNHEGSGIGLSLVKSLVDIQGGRISVESKCGVGTKFTIMFPVKLIDENNSEGNLKLLENNFSNHVERIKIEFADIYTL